MKTNKLILAALIASLAVPALAEDDPTRQAVTTRIITRNSTVQQNADGTIRIAFPEGAAISFSRQGLIKNAPYSARMITERQQNLADGNQIADHHATMAYRDGAGRTRQEVLDTKGELMLVTIQDPVAGATWILKPQDRTATRIARLGEAERQAIRKAAEAGRKAGEAAHARVEQMRKDGTLPTVERHTLDDGKEEIIVKRVVRAEGEAREQIKQDVRIQVSKELAENGAAVRDAQARLAPLTAGAFGDMKWAVKAATKDLGTRDFNGVKAEGKLRSYEIPAGEIGNRNPIVVADETWYAPDLQITVYTKHSDPRSGDTVFSLDNLKRDEPAASLFAVPADYTVKDPLAKLAEKAGKAQ
jgi:predicted transcriptional regulator